MVGCVNPCGKVSDAAYMRGFTSGRERACSGGPQLCTESKHVREGGRDVPRVGNDVDKVLLYIGGIKMRAVRLHGEGKAHTSSWAHPVEPTRIPNVHPNTIEAC
jgi:hypothetical protein